MHHVLTYVYADDYLQRRGQARDAHLRLAWAAVERGELVLGGAVGDPPDTGLLVFDVDDASAVEAFARADPYVTSGVVTSWHVRPWTTVVGRLAHQPVRPDP